MLARGVACRHFASARVGVWPPDEEPTGVDGRPVACAPCWLYRALPVAWSVTALWGIRRATVPPVSTHCHSPRAGPMRS